MLTNMIFAVIYFIEMIISYIFFSRVADAKLKFAKCLIIGTALFEVGILINHIFLNPVLWNSLFTVIVNAVFALTCFKIKPQKAFFYSFLLFIFAAAFEFSTAYFISSLTKIDVNAYTDMPMILIIESSISKILYFLLCIILINFITKERNDIKFPISLYTYPIIAIFSLLSFWYISVQNNISHRGHQLFAVVSIALLSATVLIFLSYQNNVKKENQYILMQNELKRLKTEKNYYDVLEHQNQQLMIYAHDTKNHLAAIKALNENPQIDEYIQKMTNDLSEYSRTCHSGNMNLDVIISRYITECTIKNVSFTFNVKLNNLKFMEDFDLVTVLGNLLDNALESAEKSNKKYITLETNYRNFYNIIVITNSCDTQPVINNNRLITTKKDKDLHGLGLKSVSNTLKKYNGDANYDYSSDKNEFITTVMLKKI